MDFLVTNYPWPILSVLIFLPLAGALLLPLMRSDSVAKVWALAVTLLNAGLSFALFAGFDSSTAQYQFGEHRSWIPSLNINYTLGVDGISLLLVLMTTMLMPLCVLVLLACDRHTCEGVPCLHPAYGNLDARRVPGAGLRAVLRLLGSNADPDVPADRRLGWSAQGVCIGEVLPVHARRLGVVAGGHDRPLPAQHPHVLNSGANGATVLGRAARHGCSWRFSSPSRSRCRCSRSTPGCRRRTWRRPTAGQRAACQRAPEDGCVRLPAVLPAHDARWRDDVRAVRACAVSSLESSTGDLPRWPRAT